MYPLFLIPTFSFFQGEIGVFFPLIVLRPLDSLEVNQKISVLRYIVLSDLLFYKKIYCVV